MATSKCLDEHRLIASLLHDVFRQHDTAFNRRSQRNTLNKVFRRLHSEGLSFLTKTLPKLGKAFDKALSEHSPLIAVDHRFAPMPDSKLPMLFGELFSRVLNQEGYLLPNPCTKCVASLRQILYLFYKYELPYTDKQEHEVIAKFERTELDLATVDTALNDLQRRVDEITPTTRVRYGLDSLTVTRKARHLLSRVFSFFDPAHIKPRHGPGAVATKQQPWEKWTWTNIAASIRAKYPIDEYFYSSAGVLADTLQDAQRIGEESLPARVVLVPKDSRGPRLISCEPVDFQWIQQGLSRAIVELVENNKLTKFNVFFTDQGPNRRGAELGSKTGRYATLDLNEASDRVSLELVRLLFPPHIYEYLESCRSLSTVLPDGREIKLRKFAPMGSGLCFPILALTVWAILTAAAPNADTRDSILVYGDDVIVPSAFAQDAMEQLESFGLKINRDKSCIKGLFRESCGMDAFNGVNVTPVRLRTVWSSSRSPGSYTSWIAYANSFYDRGYWCIYELIVESLHHVYGEVPDERIPDEGIPRLRAVINQQRPIRSRGNARLQVKQNYVWTIKPRVVHHDISGYSMLHRWLSEASERPPFVDPLTGYPIYRGFDPILSISASAYTCRNTSMLVKRWR